MTATGKVKFFDNKNGFGFIVPDDGGKDVFFHKNELEKSGLSSLTEKQKVSYNIKEHKGKQSACDITII